MEYLKLILIILVPYLLGSINTSIVVGKIKGIDIKSCGSGNAGLTNTFRTMGAFWALIVLFGDVLKTVIAIIFTKFIVGDTDYIALQISGICVILGHVYPIFYKFRGGKAVLTTITVVFMLNYKLALICLLVFIIIVLLTRYVALGSIIGSIILTILTLFSNKIPFIGNTGNIIYFSIVAMIIIVIKHKGNIVRMLNGSENKFHFHNKTK